MISYEKQCIFVHIPKTGGTSVENAIWGRDLDCRTERDLWMGAVRPGYNKYQTGGLQHLLASQISQEVGSDVFDRFFKFSFVRNPWSKTVSQFCYARTRKDLMKFIGMSRWTSFRRYLDLIQETEHVQSYEQWRFIVDSEGNRLVDFVGRFEEIDADFAKVAGRIGMSGTALPHDRRRKHKKDFRTYYNSTTVDKVAEIYCRDIEMFDYRYPG